MQQEILFHKYRIIKLLGRGGTAQVYLAEHIKLNSYRALKCIPKNHPLYDLQLKEAHILKNLKHSCIPIIYDIEEDEDCSYIIEQYLEGESLRDYKDNRNDIEEDIITHFAIQLCDLIHYLHSIERPILYLDIKPENIIIAGKTLKLIDFGSAVYQDELKEKQIYQGTRGYAAPEQYKTKKIDERSDVYGIGMLLFFLVTGVTFQKDMSRVGNIDFIKNCSKQMKNIINQCLKYNPSQRYASVSQLNKHLSAIVRRKKKNICCESGQSIRFAIAGAQPRIGVTHLAFCLCNYYISQKTTCLYEEKNETHCVWSIKKRYDGLVSRDGIFEMEGIPMYAQGLGDATKKTNYQAFVQDYGCLTAENLTEFLKADVKILILGAKDWELAYAEKVLDIVTEYKDIFYLFNYMDGRQFQQVMKSMERRNCYRIPYDPNPFAKPKESNSSDFIRELIRAALP